MSWFFNPWVISITIIAVIVGNLAALKYSAHITMETRKKRHDPKQQLNKLNELDKQNHPEAHQAKTKKDH